MYEITTILIFNQIIKIMNRKWYIVIKLFLNFEIEQRISVSTVHYKTSEYQINFMNTK